MKSGDRAAYHAAWYRAHREEECAKRLERYYNLDGRALNRVRLQQRRYKALARMAERHAPKEQEA